MKKYLIQNTGKFYKANLHCHTNESDGRNTAEEVKAAYMKKGYSVVAYTNHDIMINKNHLTDENFLALNGFESQAPGKGGDGRKDKCVHINYVSLDKNNVKHPLYHSTDFNYWGEDIAAQIEHEDGAVDFERYRTPECINEMIKRGTDNNFFVTYNHPIWSMEDYTDYIQYNGMNAMEIYNAGGLDTALDEFCPQVYDAMLRKNKRIYCIMTDDSHDVNAPFGGGWTMIKADKLDYETIAKSLKDGQFYCSKGPEIYDLWIEDGEVHIKCSKAKKIAYTTGIRAYDCKLSVNGEAYTEASFKINPDHIYFRLSVFDFEGNAACTNAYFTDEVL